jgi:hypothetical protein
MNLHSENILIVVTFWVFFWLCVALVIILWTLARQRRWRKGREATEHASYQSTHDAEGRPMPPLGRGLCQVCSAAPPWVYHLDDGRRLCPECLAREGRRAQVPPPPGLGNRR